MDASCTRIAHLSDVHMLDTRSSRARASWSMGHRFLSFGRPLDATGRRGKLAHALSAARRAGAHHVVISGDLTEIGAPGEFESLAESLHDSGFAPGCITLVPGNHDVYTSPDCWERALDGPLAAFRATSASARQEVVECAGVRLLPIDVTHHQPVTRSAGCVSEKTLDVLRRCAADPRLGDRPLVVVQHHPPFVRKTRALHWVDGLIGAAHLMALLEAFRHLFVLHGHLHHIVNRSIGRGVDRIFGATAVVDDRDVPRVRLYDVSSRHFAPVGAVTG